MNKKIENFRVLEVHDNFLIICNGYDLFYFDLEEKKIESETKIIDLPFSLFSKNYFLSRFFRVEISSFNTLSNGNQICVGKKAIFFRENRKSNFKKKLHIDRGSRPMNLCIDNNENIYFGEYFSNFKKKSVNIFQSKNFGRTWDICYTIDKNNINHIHGIFHDKFTNHKWVVTGDRKNECIIGYTDNDFKTFKTVFRGGQEFRTTHLFFYEKFIAFATDSQYIQNEIKIFNRDSLEITKIVSVQGSVIKAGQANNYSFLSTAVEPSKVNKSKNVFLWFTNDGINWKLIHEEKKDNLNSTLFQFGTFEFPNYKTCDLKNLYFNGRAIKNMHAKSHCIQI